MPNFVKKFASLLLAAAMVAGAPSGYGLTATAADGDACRIGGTFYPTLEAAVGRAVSGDVITVLKDVTYEDGIVLDGVSLTLDVGNNTVKIVNDKPNGVALRVLEYGRLEVTGGGEFDLTGGLIGAHAFMGGSIVIDTAIAGVEGGACGALAEGSFSYITVSGDARATSAWEFPLDPDPNLPPPTEPEHYGTGARAADGGTVTLKSQSTDSYGGTAGGNASGANNGAVAESGGHIVLEGGAAGANRFGALAVSGGTVTVDGEARGGVFGARAEGEDSKVTVQGNVLGGNEDADRTDKGVSGAAAALDGGTVTCEKDAVGDCFGVWAEGENSSVLVRGNAEASDDFGDRRYGVGVHAALGASVSVEGSAKGYNRGAEAIGSKSKIEIGGNAAGGIDAGVSAEYGGLINVAGSVSGYTAGIVVRESLTPAALAGRPWDGTLAAVTAGGTVSANTDDGVGVINGGGYVRLSGGDIAAPAYIKVPGQTDIGAFAEETFEYGDSKDQPAEYKGTFDAYRWYFSDSGGSNHSFTLVSGTAAECVIGNAVYEKLDRALAAVKNGETIRLLKNVTYEEYIAVSDGRVFTIDLNGHNLNVNNILTAGPAVSVSNNSGISLTGRGEFNATGVNYGAEADSGGRLTVTNATATGGYGAHIGGFGGQAFLTVLGSATGAEGGAYAAGPGLLTVGAADTGGDAVGGTPGVPSANPTYGARAENGGMVIVYGDAKGGDFGAYALGQNSSVSAGGSVTAYGQNGIGAYAEDGGHVSVTLDVTGVSYGVYVKETLPPGMLHRPLSQWSVVSVGGTVKAPAGVGVLNGTGLVLVGNGIQAGTYILTGYQTNMHPYDDSDAVDPVVFGVLDTKNWASTMSEEYPGQFAGYRWYYYQHYVRDKDGNIVLDEFGEKVWDTQHSYTLVSELADPVCETLSGSRYNDLAGALAEIAGNRPDNKGKKPEDKTYEQNMIRLKKDTAYSGGIELWDTKLIIELNGHNLSLNSGAYGLLMDDSSLVVKGKGEIRVYGAVAGAQLQNKSTAKITSAESDTGIGAVVLGGSTLTLSGDATGYHCGIHAEGAGSKAAAANAYSDTRLTGEGDCAAYACDGAAITLSGDAVGGRGGAAAVTTAEAKVEPTDSPSPSPSPSTRPGAGASGSPSPGGSVSPSPSPSPGGSPGAGGSASPGASGSASPGASGSGSPSPSGSEDPGVIVPTQDPDIPSPSSDTETTSPSPDRTTLPSATPAPKVVSKVAVGGNAVGALDGAYARGDGAAVTVGGEAIADGLTGTGAAAVEKGSVTVAGDARGGGNGAAATGGGKVTVSGAAGGTYGIWADGNGSSVTARGPVVGTDAGSGGAGARNGGKATANSGAQGQLLGAFADGSFLDTETSKIVSSSVKVIGDAVATATGGIGAEALNGASVSITNKDANGNTNPAAGSAKGVATGALASGSRSKVTVVKDAVASTGTAASADDGGVVSVTGKASGGKNGASATGAGATVTVGGGAAGSDYGVYADAGAKASVSGDVTGGAGVYAGGGASVTANGSVTGTATGANTFGAAASGGGTVTVKGDVSGGFYGANSFGAGSAVTVGKDVTASGGAGVYAGGGGTADITGNAAGFAYGALADGAGSAITVGGGVKATDIVSGMGMRANAAKVTVKDVLGGRIGAAATGGGQGTVNGSVSAACPVYIAVGNDLQPRAKADFVTPTTMAGYKTYTDGTNTVWVSETGGSPVAGFSANVKNVPALGGDAVFSVTGAGLDAAGVTLELTLDGVKAGSLISNDGSLAKLKLTIPPNASSSPAAHTVVLLYNGAATSFSVKISQAGNPIPGSVEVRLPDATRGSSYSAHVLGGAAAIEAFKWSASRLPDFLSIDPDSGVIHGAPAASGDYSFLVTAADGASNETVFSVTLTVLPGWANVTFSAGVLYPAKVGEEYGDGIGADSGSVPYSFTAEGLPPGMVLGSYGMPSSPGDSYVAANFGGAPTAEGIYNVAVTVADHSGGSAVTSVCIFVRPEWADDAAWAAEVAASLTWDKIKGSNTSQDEVRSDLVLPTTGRYNSTITWSSSNPAVSDGGKVTRPAYTESDVTGDLIAAVTRGTVTETVAFHLTVWKEINPAAVCAIGSTGYLTMDAALAAVPDGAHTVIKLLKNVSLSSDSADYAYTITDKKITFDLNGLDLSLVTNAGSGLDVVGSEIDYTGTGTFTITAGLTALRVSGGGSCAVTQAGVSGENAGAYAVVAQDAGSKATVNGSVTANLTNGSGVYAKDGAAVTVNGDVSADAAGVTCEGGSVTVNGTVSALADAVVVTAGGSAEITGMVMNYTAAPAITVSGGGTATVVGDILSDSRNPNTSVFVRIGGADVTRDKYVTPTTKEGYITYTDGVSAVWLWDSFVPVTGIAKVPAEAIAGTDLTLYGEVVPSTATKTAITWSVKDAGTTGAYIEDGVVLKTADAGGVTVTATVTDGTYPGADYTQDFTITVKKVSPEDLAKAKTLAAKVTWDSIRASNVSQSSVTYALMLPSWLSDYAGGYGAPVTWTSTNPAISAYGEVTRPGLGESDAAGDLVASVTVGTATVNVVFTLIVPALVAVCEIGGVRYASLGEAMADVPDNVHTTIKILRDITSVRAYHEEYIYATSKDITFDLNGKKLEVMSIYAADSTIDYINPGGFTVVGFANIIGSVVSLTGFDMQWEPDSGLTVYYSTVTIDGDARFRGLYGCIWANQESNVLVAGDVVSESESDWYYPSIESATGSHVTVCGDVTNTSATGMGVEAYAGGKVTIGGKLTAALWIVIDGEDKGDYNYGRNILTPGDRQPVSSKPGFDDYWIPDGYDSHVWVRSGVKTVIPVIWISGLPDKAAAGMPLVLNGTVIPAEATNRKIYWSVADAGTTGASLDGNILNTTAPGTAVLLASIPGGLAGGGTYAQLFSVEVMDIPLSDYGLIFDSANGLFYLDADGSGGLTDADTVYDGQAGSWSWSGGVLTLDGFMWNAKGNFALKFTGDTTLRLPGTNIFIANDERRTEAVTAGGASLVVNGVGSLNAYAGKSDEGAGLVCGSLTINGGAVSAFGSSVTAGETLYDVGIECYSLTVNGGFAAGIGTGGSAFGARGIFCPAGLTQNGGEVYAAGTYAGLSCGTAENSKTEIWDGKLTAIGYGGDAIDTTFSEETESPFSVSAQYYSYWTNVSPADPGGKGAKYPGAAAFADPSGYGYARIEAASFVPVAGILGVPDTAYAGTPIVLAGMADPYEATYRSIAWVLLDAGETGAELNGRILTAEHTGTAVVTAYIENGLSIGTPYAENFTIHVIPPFVAVTDITGVPSTSVTGVPLTLTGTVVPADATNRTITSWSVLDAGTTGAAISDGVLYTAANGTVTVYARVQGGASPYYDYAKQFTITVSGLFTPVTGITGLQSAAVAGRPLTLTGTVAPADATDKTIIWSVKNAGTTGATITGNTFLAFANGTAAVTATIANGLAPGAPYTYDFNVSVTGGPYVPVTDIAGVPSEGMAGVPLLLRGTVVPSNATKLTVTWSVADAGTTGAVLSTDPVSGRLLSAASPGTATVRATVTDGALIGTPYTKDFTIDIAPAGNVCEIVGDAGTTGYATFAAALAAVPANGAATIRLLTNIAVSAASGNTVLISGKRITLDMNGYNMNLQNTAGAGLYLSGTAAAPAALRMTGEGSLDVAGTTYGLYCGAYCDAEVTNAGTVPIGSTPVAVYCTGVVAKTSTVHVKGSVKSGSGMNAAVIAYDYSDVTVDGNVTGYSSCVSVSSATGGITVKGNAICTGTSASAVNASNGRINILGNVTSAGNGVSLQNCNLHIGGNVTGTAAPPYYNGVTVSSAAGTGVCVIDGLIAGMSVYVLFGTGYKLAAEDGVSGGGPLYPDYRYYSYPGYAASVYVKSIPFVPVTGITNAPESAAAGTPITLSAAVAPGNATDKTIIWSVKDPGTTGAAVSGDTFTASATGVAVVTATIAGGLAAGTPYTRDFTIPVFDMPASDYGLIFNTADGKLYLDVNKNGSVDAADAPYSGQAGRWSWDGSVLALNGFNWDSNAGFALKINGDAAIRLSGVNILAAHDSADSSALAADTGYGLTFEGGGALRLYGGNSSSTSYGISCTGLTINGGRIEAIGYPYPVAYAQSSGIGGLGLAAGVYLNGGSLYSSGGRIGVSSPVYVTGGVLTAVGLTSAALSFSCAVTAPAYVYWTNTASADPGGTGAAVPGGPAYANATAYKYVRIDATGSAPAFVPVEKITGVPDTAYAGTPLTLTGTVSPAEATNQTIVWSVLFAGSTGASISGNVLTASAPGAVTVAATIAGGSGPDSDYTTQFVVAVNAAYKPVTGITGLNNNAAAYVGQEKKLMGTVAPADATDNVIIWSVKDAGTTEATLNGNVFMPMNGGTAVLTATVANGLAPGVPYTADFNVSVSGSRFIPVTGITGVPKTAMVGVAQYLAGKVVPADASYPYIQWSIEDAGDTGATISANMLNTTAPGTVIVKATDVYGLNYVTPYVQRFTIQVQLKGNVCEILTNAAYPTLGAAYPTLSAAVTAVPANNVTPVTIRLLTDVCATSTTNGLTITDKNIVIDMNGHDLNIVGPAGYGLSMSGKNAILRVKGVGSLNVWGSSYGLYCQNGSDAEVTSANGISSASSAGAVSCIGTTASISKAYVREDAVSFSSYPVMAGGYSAITIGGGVYGLSYGINCQANAGVTVNGDVCVAGGGTSYGVYAYGGNVDIHGDVISVTNPVGLQNGSVRIRGDAVTTYIPALYPGVTVNAAANTGVCVIDGAIIGANPFIIFGTGYKLGAGDGVYGGGPLYQFYNYYSYPGWQAQIYVGNQSLIPVTDITGAPVAATAWTPVTLTGTVVPADATNRTVAWSVKDAGTTGAAVYGGALYAGAAGTAVITARIRNGVAVGTDYVKDFTIFVNAGFVAVTDITGVPSTATAGMPLTLTGTIEPPDATSAGNGIVWSVKDAGTTGAAVAGVSGNTLTTTAAGTVVVTATVKDRSAVGTDYTKDFTITVNAAFIPVTNITGVPSTATAGTPLTLTGTIEPFDATSAGDGIVWSVKDAGTTGAAVSGVSGDTLTTAAAGTVIVTATVKDGAAVGTDYTKDFTITVNAGFVPVTDITGVPSTATAGTPLTLTGVIEPFDATSAVNGIIWSVKDAGTTGAAVAGGVLTTAAAGTVIVTATVKDGAAVGTDYAKDFTITADPAPITDHPTGEIRIGSNRWRAFWNAVTFGLFFKTTQTVTITGEGSGEGVTIEYCLAASEFASESDAAACVGWTAYTGPFGIDPNNKYIVYAKLTGEISGLVTCINSAGVVLYTDSEAVTANIGYTIGSGLDRAAEVTLNGNAVGRIMNGTAVLRPGTDYTVTGGTITFGAAYLGTLSAGEYTLTVYYDPLGAEYPADPLPDSEAPMPTVIYLTVSEAVKTVSVGAQNGALTEGAAGSCSYAVSTANIADGTYPVALSGAPAGVTADGVAITGGAGTLIVRASAAAGTYTLTAAIGGAVSNAFDLVIGARPLYALTVAAGAGGSVSGTVSGKYAEGYAVNVTATADSGYHFVNWTATGVTLADNTNSAAAFAMPAGAVTITANFEKDAAVYALTVAAGAGGSVSGTVSGKYAEGYAVNVTATADSGYHFVNWTVTGVTLADNTNSAAAFAMPAGAVTITANFEKDAALYALTVAAGAGGSVSGTVSGKYAEGYAVNVTATADSGYHFVNWTATGVTLADNTNSAAAFAMPAGAVTITANFEKDASTYALTVAAGAGGSVTGTASGKYAEGYAVSVTATADSGYHFVNWTATGVTLADNTNSAAAFAMPAGGVTITANFEKDAAELSGDAALALLAADGFALSPAFDPDVNFYALTVEYGVANVTIRAAARSGKAEVTGGVGTSALAVGGNTFIIYVKAENGDINAYTVTVTRKAAPVFTVTVKSMAAKVGKPLQIPYVYDGSGPLAFTSSNPAVCGVGQTGILTPMKAGTAVITISAPGFPNYVFAVTVTN